MVHKPEAVIIGAGVGGRCGRMMRENLVAVEPDCYPLYQKYIREGYNFFKMALADLLNRNFYHIFQLNVYDIIQNFEYDFVN